MNKQLTQQNTSCFDRSKQKNLRELSKILFDTLKNENGLAIKMIVRDYQQKQQRENYVYNRLQKRVG